MCAALGPRGDLDGYWGRRRVDGSLSAHRHECQTSHCRVELGGTRKGLGCGLGTATHILVPGSAMDVEHRGPTKAALASMLITSVLITYYFYQCVNPDFLNSFWRSDTHSNIYRKPNKGWSYRVLASWSCLEQMAHKQVRTGEVNAT